MAPSRYLVVVVVVVVAVVVVVVVLLLQQQQQLLLLLLLRFFRTLAVIATGAETDPKQQQRGVTRWAGQVGDLTHTSCSPGVPGLPVTSGDPEPQ